MKSPSNIGLCETEAGGGRYDRPGGERSRLRRIRTESEQSDQLLLNVLPKPIVERLRKGNAVTLESMPQVTILFADLAGFTSHLLDMPCFEMVRLLNDLFFGFDLLAESHGMEKIKTIGDAYMAVSGLFSRRRDHAEAAADFALAIEKLAERFRTPSGERLLLRIGLNTGPVVAGIIGHTRISYDLWGDAVNTASRMESHGRPGAIHVSPATYNLLSGKYSFEDRGRIDVKGKGEMRTYFLKGKKAAKP
jgi:adenylate cyclase